MDAQELAPGQDAVTCSSTATSSVPPLLNLPDELLLCIAVKLAKNTDLGRLALVNKKLKVIAQEALLKEVLMPPNGIVKLLDTLCGRLDLVTKIKSVDLGDYQIPTIPGIRDERLNVYTLDKANLFRRLRSAIDSTNGKGLFDRIIASIGSENEQSTIWTHSSRYYLQILVALTPSLKELTIWLPERNVLMFDDRIDPVNPFEGPALQLLQQRLRVLTLSSATFMSLRTHNVDLHSLSQLVHLSLPMDALILPTMDATDPLQTLPASLQCLQIRPCNKGLVIWILEFAAAFVKGGFPKFQRLELFWGSCLRSSLLLLGQGMAAGLMSAFCKLLHVLRDNGMTFGAFRGDGTSAGDLLEELAAWSYLSDLEIMWAATKGMQFSAAAARTELGTPRKRTGAETRLFLRGTRKSIRLRKVCRFEFSVSVPSMEKVTFGKDKKSKLNTAHCTFDPDEWCKVLNHYRLLDPDVVMEDAPALLQESKYILCNITDLERYPTPLPPHSITSTFNANEWLGLSFFSKEVDLPSERAASEHPKKRIQAKSAPVASRRRTHTSPVRRMKQKVA